MGQLKKEEEKQECVFEDTNINPVISSILDSFVRAMRPTELISLQSPKTQKNEERNI